MASRSYDTPSRPLYDRLAGELALAAGAQSSQMFGMPSLKLDGKAFAGFFEDAMVFKLTGDAHAQALSLAGAALFDPAGMGRPMREWVVVPAEHAERWTTLARAALDYVATAPTPKKKAKAR